MRFGKFTPSHLPPPRTKGENKVSIVILKGQNRKGQPACSQAGLLNPFQSRKMRKGYAHATTLAR